MKIPNAGGISGFAPISAGIIDEKITAAARQIARSRRPANLKRPVD
jgi:hypothetical protein